MAEMRIPIAELMERFAGFCQEAAYLFLRGAAPAEPGTEPIAPWELEQQYWIETLESDAPAAWVGEIAGSYLAEAAHQLLAIAQLLRSGTVTAALDPLVRAVLERSGRVIWVLDPNIDSRARAIRAGLELGVSYQHYRETLSRLGADAETRNSVKKDAVSHRDLLEKWFAVERPPVDPCDETSKPTKDMTRWVVEGQSPLTFTRAAEVVLATSEKSRPKAAGSYAGLSGFSHPSVVFSREHRRIGDSGAVTFRYQASDLEKSARFAMFSFLVGLRHWAAYYQAGKEVLQKDVDSISGRVDAISVLGLEAETTS